MGRKLIYLDDVIEALIEKGQASKRYSMSEKWELNYTEICDVIEDLPSAQPDLSDDGTLMMTVPHGILSDVKRVMVDEVGTKFCKVMYQDEPERKKGEWIPVSERLPEVHRSILIATSQGYVAEGEYDGMYDDHHKWIQYRWSATLWDDEVIAWMPLPEPYKGETR